MREAGVGGEEAEVGDEVGWVRLSERYNLRLAFRKVWVYR